MDTADSFRSAILDMLVPAAGLSKNELDGLLEEPPKGIHADLALPCFVLAKKLKKPPHEIAAELSLQLAGGRMVKRVEAVGPYVNFFADWVQLGQRLLATILKEKQLYGDGTKRKKTIMVEFAQPNTHKAFHIGHVRNIALGAALSRLLEHAGYRVVRANYQGDIGPHVATCLWGLIHLRMREPHTGRGRWLGEVYTKANQAVAVDPAKKAQVRDINKKLYAGDSALRKLMEKTRKWSLDYFEAVYNDFGVKFDRLYFESEVEAAGVKLARKLLKDGIAKKSEGAIVMDLKKFGLGVYVLLTRDGTPLYSIKDIILASLQDSEFHPDYIIHIVGTEQRLHFRQLFKTLELTNPRIAGKELHLPYELVTLASGKMSSRVGRVISYDDLKDEAEKHALQATKKHASVNMERTAGMVAMGGIIYDMLKQSPEKTILFDWGRALSFDGNAAPYLQYTHARACSIIAKARDDARNYTASFLSHEKERTLLKKLLSFPAVVQSAARDYRPHYIANYAFELATLFNDFYQNIPVLKAPPAERAARLALTTAVQLVLNNSLTILGIDAPAKM